MLMASVRGARAADDIQGPGGEVPTPAGVSASSNDDAPASTPKRTKAAKDHATAKKSPDQASPPDDSAGVDHEVVWDSYSDLGKNPSVARDVTNGVRVEDIVEPPSDYRYAAFGKADPFVPPLLAYTEDEPGPGALEIPLVSPLQRYELEQLKVVGIWQLKSGERKAMVMAPSDEGGTGASGVGIIVKNGDLIGKRGGKILGIGEDYVNVREFSLAPDGSRRFEDRQMFMGKRADEDLAGKIRFKPGEKSPEVIIESDPNRTVSKHAAAEPDPGAGQNIKKPVAPTEGSGNPDATASDEPALPAANLQGGASGAGAALKATEALSSGQAPVVPTPHDAATGPGTGGSSEVLPHQLPVGAAAEQMPSKL